MKLSIALRQPKLIEGSKNFGRRVFLAAAGPAARTMVSRSYAASGAYDVLVYGGTASGVIAACAAARQGARVLLIGGPSPIGGMVTQGLSATDIGNSAVIGGLTRAFFERIGRLYARETPVWDFEPHVAERAMYSMLRDFDVPVIEGREFDALRRDGARLEAIKLEDGTVLSGTQFIDATYEGDLLASAGVSYTVGRESRAKYGEQLAGTMVFPITSSVHADAPDGHLLPEVLPYSVMPIGASDAKLMAYNFRLCITNDTANRARFPAPPGYDPARYALKKEMVRSNTRVAVGVPLPGAKFDLNGGGLFDTDHINASWAYPEASRAARRAIRNDHSSYQMGLLHFMANDPGLPAPYRERAAQYGLALDEFIDNGHWPRQLYIREARRMVGVYVMRQSDMQVDITKSDPIAMGSYPFDSHFVQRRASGTGGILLEGTLGRGACITTTPYQIPFRILKPRSTEASNLLASVCVSASRVAFCSLRMEPQYMMMGEAAGVSAGLAARHRIPLRNLPYQAVAEPLRRHGAVISL